MQPRDTLILAGNACLVHKLRTALIIIAMAIGVAAVNILIGLGDSARLYVINEFEALGTHLVIVLPGRTETTGGQPPIFGETPRDLTLGDAQALVKNSRHISAIAPVSVGSAPVSSGRLEREANILGSSYRLLPIRHLSMAQGQFLPEIDLDKELPVCVIGHTIQRELFPAQPATGRWLRINDRRFRVIGVLAKQGQSIGVGFDDIVIVPIASAMALFDSHSLFRILVETPSQSAISPAVEEVRRIIQIRHEDEEDVTIVTQDSVVNTFDRILGGLTLAVSGIASVCFVVAGVLIMNVMLVSVSQRTAEIGLLKALGATRRQILSLFLIEAALLSANGVVLGSLIAFAGIYLLQWFYPAFPLMLPHWAFLAAFGLAIATGLVFGGLPARKAAALDPISALARR